MLNAYLLAVADFVVSIQFEFFVRFYLVGREIFFFQKRKIHAR